MRGYDGMLELRPSLIGTITAVATACGAPVDTLGFADVLATLVLGAVSGSGTGATGSLAIKIQESGSPTGTGALWTDITDGAVHAGSFDFDAVALANTDPQMYKQTQYEILGIGRKRWIRAHASMSGTAGISPKFCVQFLLGRPNDTLYIGKAATQGTGNTEFTKGL